MNVKPLVSVNPVDAPVEIAPAPESTPMIEARGLTKVFGNLTAIEDVSFTVGKGELLGFLGPNGAGKSTTMRILSGFTPATSGRAVIAGHDIQRNSFAARRALGYLPESAPVDLASTVACFLTFIAEIKRLASSERSGAVDRAIEECGLGEVRGRMIGNLSKGFRQRVGLAQAILGDPEVLILDEPTVGLDPRQITEIRRLIKDMAGRRTVLLSTHILPEVQLTCTKVIVINRGRIVASGTPDSLVSRIEGRHPIIATVEAEPARAQQLLECVEGVGRVELDRRLGVRKATFHVFCAPSASGGASADPRPAMARAIVEAGMGLVELTQPGVTLEDVFMHAIADPPSGADGSDHDEAAQSADANETERNAEDSASAGESQDS